MGSPRDRTEVTQHTCAASPRHMLTGAPLGRWTGRCQHPPAPQPSPHPGRWELSRKLCPHQALRPPSFPSLRPRGWLLGPESVSFSSGLAAAGGRQQARAFVVTPWDLCLGEPALGVGFGCRLKGTRPRARAPCRQFCDLHGTALLSEATPGADPPQAGPGSLIENHCREEAWGSGFLQ